MSKPTLYSLKTMLARLENPYWSPEHPTMYVMNCEGDYGPGVEFKTNAQFRSAWNVFWAMSYKLNMPKQVAKLNVELMHKVIEAAVAVSRINITVAGTRFSVGQLSLLMPHGEFMDCIAREVKQLYTDRAHELLGGLDPTSLIAVLGKRMENPKMNRNINDCNY